MFVPANKSIRCGTPTKQSKPNFRISQPTQLLFKTSIKFHSRFPFLNESLFSTKNKQTHSSRKWF